MRSIQALLPVLFLGMLVMDSGSGHAATPRWAYEAAYGNVLDGDWHRDQNDDLGPYVANRQSYVLRSLAAMYRATADPVYLDRLAYHVDGVLGQ